MGEIVFAAATVHAPQLFTYPPSEDKAQLDADIAAMRELGKNLDEIKPDAVMVIGSDGAAHIKLTAQFAPPWLGVTRGQLARDRPHQYAHAIEIASFQTGQAGRFQKFLAELLGFAAGEQQQVAVHQVAHLLAQPFDPFL